MDHHPPHTPQHPPPNQPTYTNPIHQITNPATMPNPECVHVYDGTEWQWLAATGTSQGHVDK